MRHRVCADRGAAANLQPNAPGRRLPSSIVIVRNRIAECYRPGSQDPLGLRHLRYVAVHHTSLSRPGEDNPHPISDALLDGPALAGRFVASRALGTGCRVPYHVLVRADGSAEQMLPLSVEGSHVAALNPVALGVAVVGETAPATPEQIAALLEVCRRLRPLAGGLEILGHHPELGDEASHDASKRCPGVTVSMAVLRLAVEQTMPPRWQLLGPEWAEQWVTAAGLVL